MRARNVHQCGFQVAAMAMLIADRLLRSLNVGRLVDKRRHVACVHWINTRTKGHVIAVRGHVSVGPLRAQWQDSLDP